MAAEATLFRLLEISMNSLARIHRRSRTSRSPSAIQDELQEAECQLANAMLLELRRTPVPALSRIAWQTYYDPDHLRCLLTDSRQMEDVVDYLNRFATTGPLVESGDLGCMLVFLVHYHRTDQLLLAGRLRDAKALLLSDSPHNAHRLLEVHLDPQRCALERTELAFLEDKILLNHHRIFPRLSDVYPTPPKQWDQVASEIVAISEKLDLLEAQTIHRMASRRAVSPSMARTAGSEPTASSAKRPRLVGAGNPLR